MNKHEFYLYFLEFYGPVGLYPLPFRVLKRDVLNAVKLRGPNFEGDSIDREAVRDILLVANNRLGGAFELKLQGRLDQTLKRLNVEGYSSMSEKVAALKAKGGAE